MFRRLLSFAFVVAAGTASAQDTRTVTEPVFPPVCTTLSSQMAIVNNGPASETTPDTARIQAALTACGAGKAVELAASGGNYAFLSAPLNIPSGVSLIVDGGVTLYASRNREDYQTATISSTVDECGTDGPNGNGCKNFLLFNNNSTNVNSGLYGYGVIDGRGYATTLKAGADTGVSWWQNADNYGAGQSQNNPILMKLSKSTNFTLYKITLRNSPEFHVGWAGTGFTAWGVKIQAPFTAHNTDGIDPDGTNVTITNSSISDGDDNVAVGASNASANITVSNTTTYSGHGISVGSYTQAGLQNFLVTNVNMAGTGADGNATGIRLKSSQDRGGLLNNITYQNMCLKDMRHILQFTPFYNTNAGTLIPSFQNVTLQNLHFLAPSTGAYPYIVALQGHDASHISTITLNNVVFDSLLQSNTTSTPPEYEAFTLGGNVYPAFLQSLTGTGVTYTGTATANATGGYSCSAASFPYEVGELYLSTASATNLQTASVASNATFTLNAMLQPAMATQTYNGTAGNYTGAAAMTKPVNFLEGSTVVGTGTLAANGTLASLPLTGVTPGTHTYTAQYPGDANYAALSFGSVTVNVSAVTAATTTTVLAANAASATYGTGTVLTATLTTATAAPGGSMAFLDGNMTLATVSLSGKTAATTQVLGGGAHSLTAVYSGDASDSASTSPAVVVTITPATAAVTLAAAPASMVLGASTTVTANVARVSGASMPTGTVNVMEGTAVVGTGALDGNGNAVVPVTPVSAGSHSYTAAYLGDANYAAANTSVASTVTVAKAGTTAVLSVSGGGTYPAMTTLTAAVTASGATPSATPATGTVTFYDGTAVLGTASMTSGSASLAVTLAGGTHSVSCVYNGDSNFTGSTCTAVGSTVAKAGSSTGLLAGATTVALGGSTTFTGTVAGAAGGAVPSGMLQLFDGTTQIGSATLDATGKGTITGTFATAGAHSLTVQYTGDANYGGSTSTAVAVTVTGAPAFSMASSASTLSLAAGGSGTPTLTLTPANGFSGTVALTCSSPVSYIGCAVSPGSVAVSGQTGATATATISVAATVAVNRSAVPPVAWLAGLLPLTLLGLMRRRKLLARALVALAFGLVLCAGISGCGGGSTAAASGPKLPPAGTSVVTVTATNGTLSSSVQISVVVTN